MPLSSRPDLTEPAEPTRSQTPLASRFPSSQNPTPLTHCFPSVSCSWLTSRRRKCFVWYLSVRRTVASLPSLISQRPRSAFPATRTREKENVCAARDIRVTGRFQSHSSWSKLIGSNWLLNISVCLATLNCARYTLYNGYAPPVIWKKYDSFVTKLKCGFFTTSVLYFDFVSCV